MGKHENLPKNTQTWLPEWCQKAPGGSLGPLLESTLFSTTFFHRIWLPLGLHFGSLLGSILKHVLINFLNPLPERPRPVLGQIWEPFGLHVGTFLARFLGYLATAKTVKNQRENTIFQGSGTFKNTFFSNTLFKTPPGPPLGPIFTRLGSILGRFWGPLGTIFSCIFGTFFDARFLTPKYTQNGENPKGCGSSNMGPVYLPPRTCRGKALKPESLGN